MVISIPSKPEIFLQHIRESMIFSIQAKPETPTFWLLLCLFLHISVLYFYKYIGYYVIDRIMNIVIYNNNTWFQCTGTDNNDDKKNSMYI